MGNIFSNENLNIPEKSEDIKLNLLANYKKNDSKLNFDILDKPNSRSKKVKTVYQKYAPDINTELDLSCLKNDLNKFVLVKYEKGFTSIVNIYKYNNFKIVEKCYKDICKDSNYYVDSSFLKESFQNELSALLILEKEPNFPKILNYNEEDMKLLMTYNGDKLADKPENINLSKIPKNWKLQLYHILCTLKKYNLYHNDITVRNMCLQNNTFYLIDFGNCKKNIDLYYRNFYSDLLLMSENIIDFFKKIDNNANEIRKCCYNNDL